MTQLELVQDPQSAPLPITSVTGKTLEDYKRELALLVREQQSVKELVADLSNRSARWQRMVGSRATGRCTDAELLQAEQAMDEAQNAVARVVALDRAIVDAQSSVEYMTSQVRIAFVRSVEHDFDELHDQWRAAEKNAVELFKQLLIVSRKYQALTNRDLMPNFYAEANYPSQTGMLGTRSGITTALEIIQK